jgi:hypothetical protein
VRLLRFNLADVERANAEWGCNCGPAALAAICGLTLDEARPHMGDFESKRYTNPTLMFAALQSVGLPWQRVKTSALSDSAARMPWWGLCRIQWQGPWTSSGAPPRWAYRQTHWIGAAKRKTDGGIGVFDINCVHDAPGSGWVAFQDWAVHIVPSITAEIRHATGGWHITHAIEVEDR